jgi:hypothetical protein
MPNLPLSETKIHYDIHQNTKRNLCSIVQYSVNKILLDEKKQKKSSDKDQREEICFTHMAILLIIIF